MVCILENFADGIATQFTLIFPIIPTNVASEEGLHR